MPIIIMIPNCIGASIGIVPVILYIPSCNELISIVPPAKGRLTINGNKSSESIVSATHVMGVAGVIRTPYTSFPDGITDLNDFQLPTGVYVLSVLSTVNAPTGVGWCVLENIGSLTRRVQRIASLSVSGEIYMRTLQMSSGVVTARPWKIVNTNA